MFYLEWIDNQPCILQLEDLSNTSAVIKSLFELQSQFDNIISSGFPEQLALLQVETQQDVLQKCINSKLGKLLSMIPSWPLSSPILKNLSTICSVDSIVTTWFDNHKKYGIPYLVCPYRIIYNGDTIKGTAFCILPPDQTIDAFQIKKMWINMKNTMPVPKPWEIDLPIAEESPTTSGLIYLIKSGDRAEYKIGWTTRKPESRLAEIKTSCPKAHYIGYWKGVKQIEAILHKIFAEKRIGNANEAGQEWFELNKEDIELVKSFFLE